MAYLVQQTRVSSLTVGGVDFTNSLVDWVASDLSANRNGYITTTGTLTLGQNPGGTEISDYDRDLFKRGTPVILTMQEPGGAAYRHPRGLLYVLSASYNIEAEVLEVDLGCRIALAVLTDDYSDLLPLAPIPLDKAQENIQSIGASFTVAGKYLYQDNQGDLITGIFFDGDDSSGVAAGEWVSVLGETAISVSPLAGGQAIPDRIKLSYSSPTDGLPVDGTGKVDIVETTSNYFVSYPAVTYVREPGETCQVVGPDGRVSEISCIVQKGGSKETQRPPKTSGCGNTPPPPEGSNPDKDSGTAHCSEGWVSSPAPVFIPVVKVETSRTEYGAPGGQVSRVFTETWGPAIEVNQQYFADKFAYCKSIYAYKCVPNGACPFEGQNNIRQSYSETTYYYGEANELVEVVQDDYATTLSAAQPFNWRFGSDNGVPQGFNGNLSQTNMYRYQRQQIFYKQEDNTNVQETFVYTSMASRGVGITAAPLDALQGIETSQRRLSTTITTLDIRPDSVNTITTNTSERRTDLILHKDTYLTPPNSAGPYVVEESMPLPLLYETEEEIQDAVGVYSNYITRFYKGDLYGLQIAEGLRSDIVTNWRPGMPFRYADNQNNKVGAYRMDSCSWGVTPSEAVVITDAVWIGDSTGTLTIGNNLVGDSRPDMGSGTQPPAAVDGPPAIIGDNVFQSYYEEIDVHIWTDLNMFSYGNDGVVPPIPSDLEFVMEPTSTIFCDGTIVQAGDVLATTATGGIPLEYAGNLLVDTATVVDADLFA